MLDGGTASKIWSRKFAWLHRYVISDGSGIQFGDVKCARVVGCWSGGRTGRNGFRIEIGGGDGSDCSRGGGGGPGQRSSRGLCDSQPRSKKQQPSWRRSWSRSRHSQAREAAVYLRVTPMFSKRWSDGQKTVSAPAARRGGRVSESPSSATPAPKRIRQKLFHTAVSKGFQGQDKQRYTQPIPHHSKHLRGRKQVRRRKRKKEKNVTIINQKFEQPTPVLDEVNIGSLKIKFLQNLPDQLKHSGNKSVLHFFSSKEEPDEKFKQDFLAARFRACRVHSPSSCFLEMNSCAPRRTQISSLLSKNEFRIERNLKNAFERVYTGTVVVRGEWNFFQRLSK